MAKARRPPPAQRARAPTPVRGAQIGEGDERWIVKEREDGRNCNNWHWTTKDVSAHTKEALTSALKAMNFPPPLNVCTISSAEVKGECSILNRKGRTFLIYELEVTPRERARRHVATRARPLARAALSRAQMKLKWEGEMYDADGGVIESAKGSMKLPDVSPTMIDDLDVEYSCARQPPTNP